MFIPIGDYPNPPRAQWVTRILLGINIAVHLLVAMPLDKQALSEQQLADPGVRKTLDVMWKVQVQAAERRGHGLPPREVWERQFVSRYSLLVQQYGYVPGKPSLLGLLTCMFLHGGFMHLAGNMLYLWIFGDNVEHRLGPMGYIFAYLGTGVLATLTFAAFASDSLIPLVGASGAISGVLGFYMLWFPRNQVRVLFFFILIMFVHVRAIWVLGFYLVWDNIAPFIIEQTTGGNSPVAYGAHIGGFCAGLATAFVVNRLRGAPDRPAKNAYQRVRTVKWGSDDMRGQFKSAMEVPEHTFRDAIAAGRMEEAAHAFSALVNEGALPPDADDVYELAQWLYMNDLAADAVAVFRYYIAKYPRGDELDRVHLGLAMLLSRRLGQPAAAREHLHAAIDVTDDPQLAERARAELARLG